MIFLTEKEIKINMDKNDKSRIHFHVNSDKEEAREK